MTFIIDYPYLLLYFRPIKSVLTTKNNKKMEKKSYEAMKQLKQRVESGLATFQERTKWKIIEKRKAKGQPIHYY